MADRYDVITRGEMAPGFTIQQAQDNLCTLFKTSPEKIRHTFFSGNRAVIKKNVSYAKAMKAIELLRQAGIIAALSGTDDRPGEKGIPPVSGQPHPRAADDSLTESGNPKDPAVCPKCGYRETDDRNQMRRKGECPSCGIIIEKYLRAQSKMDDPFKSQAKKLKPPVKQRPVATGLAEADGPSKKTMKPGKMVYLWGLALLLMTVGNFLMHSGTNERMAIQKETGQLFFDRTEYYTTKWNDGWMDHITLAKRTIKAPPDPTAQKAYLGAFLTAIGTLTILFCIGVALKRRMRRKK